MAKTLTDLVSHLKARALEGDFAQSGYGYVADINSIPNAQFPYLHILQGTPDANINQTDILRKSAYEYHNIKLLVWDTYVSSEERKVALEEKWTTLTRTLVKFLQDAFGTPYFVDFKLMPDVMAPLQRNTVQHNKELAEVQITIQVRTFLGTI